MAQKSTCKFVITVITLFLFYVSIPAHAQSDWCAELKNLQHLVETDAAKITGSKLQGDDYITWYQCPVSLTGADAVETKYFTEGRIFQVVAYCGTGISEENGEGEKIYKKLLAQFKACFPSAEEIEYPHEMGFTSEAWGVLNEAEHLLSGLERVTIPCLRTTSNQAM